MDYKEQILLRMREDIRLRGLSQNTLVNYTLHARIFLEFTKRPVEQLDAVDIRNFLRHLINEKKAILKNWIRCFFELFRYKSKPFY